MLVDGAATAEQVPSGVIVEVDSFELVWEELPQAG